MIWIRYNVSWLSVSFVQTLKRRIVKEIAMTRIIIVYKVSYTVYRLQNIEKNLALKVKYNGSVDMHIQFLTNPYVFNAMVISMYLLRIHAWLMP